MNYSDDIFEKLVATIEEATSQAAIDLFNSTNETFLLLCVKYHR